LVISGIVGERIWNERIEFWEKVYGEAPAIGAADPRLRHDDDELGVL
jgi:hypothetical protein